MYSYFRFHPLALSVLLKNEPTTVIDKQCSAFPKNAPQSFALESVSQLVNDGDRGSTIDALQGLTCMSVREQLQLATCEGDRTGRVHQQGSH